MYHKDDQHVWLNSGAIAGNNPRHGKSFYVLIQDTATWGEREQREAGQGRVHDYIFESLLGETFTRRTTCCGGFSIQHGVVKTSSIWLNGVDAKNERTGRPWISDGSKYLSPGERVLVKHAVEMWARYGKHTLVTIPPAIEQLVGE